MLTAKQLDDALALNPMGRCAPAPRIRDRGSDSVLDVEARPARSRRTGRKIKYYVDEKTGELLVK